ncbi:hypothetical protein [Pseudactinotalea sp. Z1748]|uniref:hypothetical protein n=1 Tax=Pseudactinotalea sp. Z1748 TaxID=3413027 RepID=UPI003C7CF1B0
MLRTRITATAAAALAAALLLSACTGDGEEPPPQETTTEAEQDETGPDSDETDPDETEPGEGEQTDEEENGFGGPGTEPADQADLPGQTVDLYTEGETVDVVGVAHDDVLYVRELPDPASPEVTALAPLTSDVALTGRARQLDDMAIWLELDVEDRVGWANLRYLAYLGMVTDETSQISDPGPQDSMADLAAAVVEELQEDGAPDLDMTVAEDVQEGDLTTIVVDVQGYADDSINGHRLHIFASDEGGDGYRLVSVEATQICTRGATEQGCL